MRIKTKASMPVSSSFRRPLAHAAARSVLAPTRRLVPADRPDPLGYLLRVLFSSYCPPRSRADRQAPETAAACSSTQAASDEHSCTW